MKQLLLILVLATPPLVLGQQQVKQTPDCSLTLQPRTITGTSANFDNRPNSQNNGVPCTQWELDYSAVTTTISFSVQIESAGDAGAGIPGSFSIFGSAGTTVPTGKITNTGYVAFLRINLTAISGGSIQATLNGWRDNAGTINGGSSGPSSNVNIAQVAGVATTGGPNLSVNQTQIAGAGIVADPCIQQARTTALINLTASTRIITGVSAKQTYVCYLQFSISSTADNIALVEGTTTTTPCDTGTAGMAGGTTAATGWNLLANGSVTGGIGIAYAYRTATLADHVCLLVSSGAQVSGVVQYVQQ